MPNFMKPNTAHYTSNYGVRTHPVTGQRGKMHWGLDFSGHTDDNIRAAEAGTIREARMMTGFGNCIMLTHRINGVVYETIYAHLARFTVRKGQKVTKGQIIGIKGNTGSSTSKHLHFEIVKGGTWNNTYKNNVNPLHYIDDELYLGSQGARVRTLQFELNKLGYKLKVDGDFGASTDKALKDVQAKAGIKTDGRYGKGTEQALTSMTKSNVSISSTKPSESNISKNNKGEIRMFNPSNNALRKAFQDDLESAVKDKIVEAKWLNDLKQNKLSLDDAFALRVIIEQRRNQDKK